MAQFNEDINVNGTVTSNRFSGALAHTNLDIQASVVFPITLENARIWDAFQTLLTTAGSDDLGIATGTFGTGLPYITAGDVKATSSTRRCRWLVQVPHRYQLLNNISLRFAAGMLTTVADTSCALDVEVYLSARDSLKSGSDLYAGAAVTMNSLTFGNKDFALTNTTITPGAWLDVRASIAYVDAATATAVTPAIAHAELVCNIR